MSCVEPGPSGTRNVRFREESDMNTVNNRRNKKPRLMTEGNVESDMEYNNVININFDDFDSDTSESTFEETDNESETEVVIKKENELADDTKTVEDTGEWTGDGEFQNFSFEANTGFQSLPNGADPYNFFNCLFDADIVSIIVMETNKYAETKLGHNWQTLSTSEFRTFLGLLLHMGTVKCPKLKYYWSTHRLHTFDCFLQQMNLSRFQQILRSLRFSSNYGNNNCMNKIQPIIDYFNNKMRSLYYPHKKLLLREATTPWGRRIQLQQYIAGWKYKHGVRLYTLTDRSGVAVRMKLCIGKQEDITGQEQTTQVALDMLGDFVQKGHSVYMDSSCTNFVLTKLLLSTKTHCTGILQKSRKGNNEEVVNADVPANQVISRHKDNIMMGKFRGRKETLFTSSEFNASLVEFRNKRKENCKEPLALRKFNEFYEFVNEKDQMLSYYSCSRTTFKWYVKLWINIVETLVLNSFLLYSKYSPCVTKLNFHDYRLHVIDTLLFDMYWIEIPHILPELEHVPEILPKDNNNKIKRKRCRQCFASGVRKETRYFCSGCKDNPGLCLGKCFREYHTRI